MPQKFGSTSESSKIVRFGLFGFVVNQIMLESGAAYTVAGILNRENELRQFRGKRLATPQEIAKSGKPTGNKLANGKPELYKSVVDHLIVLLRAKNREGGEYLKVYDVSCMEKSNKKENKKWTVLRKSLEVVFGAEYGKTVKPATTLKAVSWFPAQAEEIPTGETYEVTDGTQDERALKFTKQFADEREMRAAESAYFAQFGNQDAAPDNGKGMSDDTYNKALKLFQALKGDEAKFRNVIAKDATFTGQDADTLLTIIKSDHP